MRLVSVHLMAPIRAPWDRQYTEVLSSRPGYSFELNNGWLHILYGDMLVQVVSGALVRSGVVETKPMGITVELSVLDPEHAKAVEQLADAQGRGRSTKKK